MGLPSLFRGINLCWILMCCILGGGGVCSGSWNPMAEYIGWNHLRFQAIDHEVLLLG